MEFAVWKQVLYKLLNAKNINFFFLFILYRQF
jgi:hypothetical protein